MEIESRLGSLWSGCRILLTKLLSAVHLSIQLMLDRMAVLGASRASGATIIIIKVDAIGDFIVWLDSARVLREHFKGRKIILVANQLCADLARASGHFDNVIAVDTSAFQKILRYRFDTIRRIRKIGAVTAIQPTYSRMFWVGDSLIRASGARERFGSQGNLSNMRPWQKSISDRWYTQLVPARSDEISEFARNAEFLTGLGIDGVRPQVAGLKQLVELPKDLCPEADYFVVFPGAGSAKRMWPADRFAATARSLAERSGWRLVVCGGPADAGLAEKIIQQSGCEKAMPLAGRTSIPELIEIVRGARLVIGNETSAVHIAAAVGTPSICLLGGGHFGRFAPYADEVEGVRPEAIYQSMSCFGCNWQCTKPHQEGGPVPCISAIREVDVMTAAEKHVLETVS